MNTATSEAPSCFSAANPRLQTAWDSTSLGLLKTCARKYQLRQLLNWAPKGEAVALVFGINYHSALETYDKVKALGESHDTAVRTAVRKALQLCARYDEAGQFIGMWKPVDYKTGKLDTVRNVKNLIRAIVWFTEQFKTDNLKTHILENGKPAVELSFIFDTGLTTPSGEPYSLSGHMDRVVEFGDELYVDDYKTSGSALTSYYFDRYNPDNQVSLYSIAAGIILKKPASGVIIDGVQLLVTGNRYARGFITRNQEQLSEWLKDLTYWIKQAEQYAIDNHYPQNDTACDKYGGCPYRSICRAAPSMRDVLLKSDFEKTKQWNPLESR
jgi:hypothetical protein